MNIYSCMFFSTEIYFNSFITRTKRRGCVICRRTQRCGARAYDPTPQATTPLLVQVSVTWWRCNSMIIWQSKEVFPLYICWGLGIFYMQIIFFPGECSWIVINHFPVNATKIALLAVSCWTGTTKVHTQQQHQATTKKQTGHYCLSRACSRFVSYLVFVSVR